MCSWPTTRKRRLGRHTSLLAGGAPPNPEPALDDGWLPPDLTMPMAPVTAAGPAAPGSGGGERSRASRARLGGGTRGATRGQAPSAGSDPMGLGEPGLFRRPPPGIGLNRPVPERPWYRRRGPVFTLAISLLLVVVTGILAAPPLLAALGGGAQTCQQCALPIPPAPAIGPASPAMSAPASAPASPTAAATPTR